MKKMRRFMALLLSVTMVFSVAFSRKSLAADAGDAHTGSYAVEGRLAAQASWGYLAQPVTGQANTDYTASIWLKGTGNVTLKILYSDWSKNKALVCSATDQWQQFTLTFNTGSSGSFIFSVYDTAGGTAGTVWMDDAFAGTSAAAQNLLSNPGFESASANWQLSGSPFSIVQTTPPTLDYPNGALNIGAYAWDRNPEGVADFGTWINKSMALGEDFLERSSWSDLEGGNRLDSWAASQYRDKLLLATYPFPDNQGNLPDAAAGAYNSYYYQLGVNLVSKGLSQTILRFGHEFNGNWYPWSVTKDPNGEAQGDLDYAEAFRQFVTTLRSVPGGNFQFTWNPSTEQYGVDLVNCYPGDAYVDYVGIDHYDQTWKGGYPIPAAATDDEILAAQKTAWNNELNDGNWGLAMLGNFADQHHKPISICEWGLVKRSDGYGGADNPYFIDKMYEWMNSHNVAFNVYFNVKASDGDHDLYDTVTFPKASAEFQKLWNPSGILPPEAVTAPFPAGSTVVEAETGQLIKGSGNNVILYGDPWASDGRLVCIYGLGAAVSYSGCPAADGLVIRYKGWQTDLAANLYVSGVNEGLISFPNHGRSWSESYGEVTVPVQVPAGATVSFRMDSWNSSWVDSLKLDSIAFYSASAPDMPDTPDTPDIPDVSDPVPPDAGAPGTAPEVENPKTGHIASPLENLDTTADFLIRFLAFFLYQ